MKLGILYALDDKFVEVLEFRGSEVKVRYIDRVVDVHGNVFRFKTEKVEDVAIDRLKEFDKEWSYGLPRVLN